jgi:hypothetical protein
MGLAELLSPVPILWLLVLALMAQVVPELAAHEHHAAGAAGPV